VTGRGWLLRERSQRLHQVRTSPASAGFGEAFVWGSSHAWSFRSFNLGRSVGERSPEPHKRHTNHLLQPELPRESPVPPGPEVRPLGREICRPREPGVSVHCPALEQLDGLPIQRERIGNVHRCKRRQPGVPVLPNEAMNPLRPVLKRASCPVLLTSHNTQPSIEGARTSRGDGVHEWDLAVLRYWGVRSSRVVRSAGPPGP
jgi:hypothetical protein